MKNLFTSRFTLAIMALLTLLCGVAAPAFADGLIVIPHPPHVIPGHFTFAPLEVVYHKVETTIDDQVAVTSVDQEFYNPNNARLEGDYIFPIPKGAQINKFTMDIDGKQVEAELLPADKARTIYEDIVRKAKDPALLEYAGQAMFKVRIFPIEPNSKKRITLKYTELLRLDNNLLDYRYTLSTEKFSSKPLKNVSMKITVNSSQPITSLYSPTHEVDMKKTGENRAVVGFEDKNVRPDTDFHLYIGRKSSPVGIDVLTYKPDPNKPGYFLFLAAPTFGSATKPLPKDVVFVIDTSGSMNGAKIEQAKKALKFCINSLNKEDRFDIVRFSTEAEPFFNELREPETVHGKQPNTNRQQALTFIDNMRATGGTAIQDALLAALAEKPAASNRLFLVVFLTDGLPTIGEQNPDKILAKVKDQKDAASTRIFSFGVGTDVNTKLLDQVAEQTRGYSQYVLEKEDIEIAVSNFFSKVQDPVLAHLKLDIPTVGIGKVYPKELPDLFKGDQLVVFGTYDNAGSTAAVLTGSVAGSTEKFAQDIKFPDQTGSDKEWIGKLWAVRRVGYLLDEIRLHGESKELKDEVVELARKWAIVTPYTAMLIIEDEKARGVASNTRSLQDMERDSTAMKFSKAGGDSLSRGKDSGSMAVSGSINVGGYKQNKSLDGYARVAEQRAERQQFEGQNGSALGRFTPAATSPTAQPAAPGSWTAQTVQTDANAVSNNGYRVVTNYAQQNRVINNRAFYLNGNQWVDANVQKTDAKAKRVQIKFDSDEYYNLLKEHPDASKWLSLGNNVTFELAGTIYEITE